jgi:hypothetical protein
MNMTEEMRRALGEGQLVEVTDPDTNEVYVLVKQEQYRAMRRLLEAEEFDPSLYEVEELELYETA